MKHCIIEIIAKPEILKKNNLTKRQLHWNHW